MPAQSCFRRLIGRMLPVVMLCVFPAFSHGQPTRISTLDFSRFSSSKQASRLHGLDADEVYESHPDYGFLPSLETPCSDCQELLGKRTATSREFVSESASGRIRYIQHAAGAINFMDAGGHWREINPRLRPSADSTFAADRQPTPISIDPISKRTTIVIKEREFVFNKSIRLVHVSADGHRTEIADADWSHVKAGDDGVSIEEIYPGIDLVFQVRRGTIESGFLLKEKLSFNEGDLVVESGILLPNGISVVDAFGKSPSAQLHGDLLFIDDSGNPLCKLKPCFAFDDSPIGIPYPLNALIGNDRLSVSVPVSWLNEPDRDYPVLIDPVVTTQGVLPDGIGGVEGTRYSTTCWTNGCDYRLVVPSPPNARLTRVSTSFEYYAVTGRCQAQDGGYSISLNGCTAPAAAPGVFTCASPLSNYYCGLSNFDITSDVAACLPVSQCASVNLSFDLHFFRCNNDPDTNCTSGCISASQPWIITLEGRDLEIPFITATQQICQGNSVDVVAIAENGIGPYVYSWSPVAGNSDTLNVIPNTTTNYTVTVTDACGTVRTATSSVDVLPSQNPGFIISNTSACTDQPIQLNGLGGNPVSSYDWIVPGSVAPGGVINDAINTSIQYSLPGTFPLTLRYSSAGCQSDSTVWVTIVAPFPADVALSAIPSGAACIGDLVTFNAQDVSNSGASSFAFYLNGNVIQSGPSAVYSSTSFQNGDLVQVVMSSNGNCVFPAIDTASLFVAISGAVTPDVQIVANDLCTGIPLLLTASPVNGGAAPAFQWSVNGVPVPGAVNATWSTTLSPGDTLLGVQMTSSSGCVTNPIATDVVAIVENSTAQVSISSDQGVIICNGQPVSITAYPVNGGVNPVYSWLLNGIPTGVNGPVFNSSTIVTGDVVSVEMTSSSSCANPATVNSTPLVFQVAPPVDLLVFGSPPVCEGESVSLSIGVSGGDGGPYDIRWNGVSGTDQYDFTPLSSQYVQIEVEDGCTSVPIRDSALVIVYTRPVAGFSFTPAVPSVLEPLVSFLDASLSAASVIWHFGDGDSSVLRNPTHQYPMPGTYEATQIVVSSNGCADSISYLIRFAENAEIWFPNSFTPNGDLVNDSWSPVGTGLKSYRFYIYDRWGGLVFEGSDTKPWPGTYRDTDADVQQGVYTWLVELDKGQFKDNKVAGQVTLIRIFR